MVAADKFYKYGIKSVTMDEIATQMGISKRTIYEKFKDKEDLLIECILFENRKNREEATQIHRESDNVLELCLRLQKQHVEKVMQISPKYYSDIKMYYFQASELMDELREQASSDLLLMFQEGIKQGVFRSDINFEIVRMLLETQMSQFFSQHFNGEGNFVDIYETILNIYVRGISTQKGIKILDEFIENEKLKK